MSNIFILAAAAYRPHGWPRWHDDFEDHWLHSDIKNVAYYYTRNVIRELVEKGELK